MELNDIDKIIENKKKIHSLLYENYLDRCCLHSEIESRCNKIDEIKALIEKPKIFGFFMYQFTLTRRFGRRNKAYDEEINKIKELIRKINEKEPLIEIKLPQEITGMDVKTCDFCKFSRSFDFGILLLNPINGNAYLESGMFLSLGKKVILLNNTSRSEKAEFDLSPFFYIPYSNLDHLEINWNRKITEFINKIKNYYIREPFNYYIRLFPEKNEDTKYLIKILKQLSKAKSHWEIYCLSKFLVSLLLYLGLKTQTPTTIASVIPPFSEIETRNGPEITIRQMFMTLSMEEVYGELREIYDSIIKYFHDKIDSGFSWYLEWTRVPLINEIVNDLIPLASDKDIFDIFNLHEKWLNEHAVKREDFIKYSGIKILSPENFKHFFEKKHEFTKKIINEEISKKILGVSLRFCEKFARKFF
ncbi:MAG: hypothetical protein ACTSVV_01560 [Promethearchaeota archaeon]